MISSFLREDRRLALRYGSHSYSPGPWENGWHHTLDDGTDTDNLLHVAKELFLLLFFGPPFSSFDYSFSILFCNVASIRTDPLSLFFCQLHSRLTCMSTCK